MNVKIKITKSDNPHFYTPEGVKSINLFNARVNYLRANYDAPSNYTIEVLEADLEYTNRFGNTTYYSPLLADCIKHNLKIVEIDGVSFELDPYKEPFVLPLFKGDEFEKVFDFKFKIQE